MLPIRSSIINICVNQQMVKAFFMVILNNANHVTPSITANHEAAVSYVLRSYIQQIQALTSAFFDCLLHVIGAFTYSIS